MDSFTFPGLANLSALWPANDNVARPQSVPKARP